MCPYCSEELSFGKQPLTKKQGKYGILLTVRHCKSKHTKRSVERAWVTRFDSAIDETIRQVKQVPVLINYSVGNKRFEKNLMPKIWPLLKK